MVQKSLQGGVPGTGERGWGRHHHQRYAIRHAKDEVLVWNHLQERGKCYTSGVRDEALEGSVRLTTRSEKNQQKNNARIVSAEQKSGELGQSGSERRREANAGWCRHSEAL